MSQSSIHSTSFLEEVRVLGETAELLGKFGRTGQRDEFEATLQALGFAKKEAATFWDALDVEANKTNGKPWHEAEDNTAMATRLGLLLLSNNFPRNLLLYGILQGHFPDILRVGVTGTRHIGGRASRKNPETRRVHFHKAPRDNRGTMAIHRVYKGERPQEFMPEVLLAARRLSSVLGEDVGLRLANVLFESKMLIPPETMAKLLAKVIAAGQSGHEVVMAGAFCPDYAYEQTGNPQIPYRYTFDGLGIGVGLVAQQFVRIVPALSAFLQSLGVRHRIVLGIGDFEADSEDVLRRVGLTHDEFVERCQKSLEAFERQIAPGLPITLELFGKERGKERFRNYTEEAKKKMMTDNFGRMPDLYDDLQQCLDGIHHQYGAFYRRWYGNNLTEREVRDIVFAQGAEYASVARIYNEDFGENVIILAGDRPEMHRFNALFQLQPTLCAKRAY